MYRSESGIEMVPWQDVSVAFERVAAEAWENGKPEGSLLIYNPRLDLEEQLINWGWVVGLIGGVVAANMFYSGENMNPILSATGRVVANIFGSAVGVVFGAGSGWAAARIIDVVRSRQSQLFKFL